MDLRYPIGRYRAADVITREDRLEWIDEIAALPGRLREAVEDLSDGQLDTPYRPGGWTVRRGFVHPELGQVALDWSLGMYAWHSRHHVAQIVGLRKREGWQRASG